MEKRSKAAFMAKHKQWLAPMALIGVMVNWYGSPALAAWEYGFELREFHLPDGNNLFARKISFLEFEDRGCILAIISIIL